MLAAGLLVGMVLGPSALGLSSAPGCGAGYGGGGYGGGYGGAPGAGGYNGYATNGYGGFGHCYDGETPPNPYFSVGPQFPHVGGQVKLSSIGSFDASGPITSYDWDLDGDGQYDDAHGTAVTTSFTTAGQHVVGLALTDDTGLTSELRQTVDVHSGDLAPHASLSSGFSAIHTGQPTTFSANADDLDSTPLAITWDLDNDGQFDDGSGPQGTTTFATTGPHTVKALIDDGDGSQVTATGAFQVYAPNTGSFSPTPIGTNPGWPRAGRSTYVFASNSFGGFTLAWEFGDGGSTTGSGPTHTWAAAGSYDVHLTATDSSTTVVSDTHSPVTVLGQNIPPTLSLYGSPTDPRTGQQVRLQAYGYDLDGPYNGVTYAWDTNNDGQFDDGTGPTITRPAPTAGPATVAVRATDGDGGTSVATLTTRIRSIQPTGAFTVSPQTAEAGAVVHFSSESIDTDGTIAQQQWDLDDDGQFDDATGANAAATFSTTGKHIVKLLVRDSSGDTDAVAHTVNVVAPATVTQPVAPGGTVSTGSQATEADPVTSSVTSPVAGQITITETAPTASAPSGYSFLTQEVEITAPAATAGAPLVLKFQIDASIIPAGTDPATITVFRDGVAIAACTGASGVASPDPCVSERTVSAGGDLSLTILSSHASRWNFGAGTSTGGGSGGGGGGSGDGSGGSTTTTTTPTATTSVVIPVPVTTPAARDLTAPVASLGLVARQALKTALKKGLKVSVTCSEPCTIQASAGIAKALAKKLGLGKTAVIVARGKGLSRVPGKTVVTLKFTKLAAKKLAKAKSVALSLSALVGDAAGNTRTVKKTVALSR